MIKLNIIKILCAVFLSFGLGQPSLAYMRGLADINLDFTKPDEASKQATWGGTAGQWILTREGLTWEGKKSASTDCWIQSLPLAVGFNWRPVTGVTVDLKIQKILPTSKPNKEVAEDRWFNAYKGEAFIRYSMDQKHWSCWQNLMVKDEASLKQHPNLMVDHFEGQILIPRVQREEYEKLLDEYQQLDVPWINDENAAVRWIVAKDPTFLERPAPFIGYIQLRYETCFPDIQRLKALTLSTSFGASGLFSPPKDMNSLRNKQAMKDGPWSYVAP